jgi:energy-coupling factor transporter ATP-binding protein EcfA2
MRLKTIRLYPFGHFTDQSWDLEKPLVVIHGPNQLGKSTLRHAIYHVLFTPTKLPTTKLESTVGPWLPLPAGDYAAVTLTFEHGGMQWTLEKRWGAGPSSRLSDGKTSIADPAAVQAKLAEMLAHGEATFRHVLFTGQAELEQTLATIKNKAAEVRDIRDLLKAAAGAAADVDEQPLRRVLGEKIKEAFGRWDDERGTPERQKGKEKGLEDPWINGAGHIAKTWYAWQTHEAERAAVLRIETELDGVTAEAATIEQEIGAADEFTKRFGGLREALVERNLLNERLPRLDQDVATVAAAFSGWPTAEAAINEWNKRKPELEADRDRILQERADAEARKAGAATKAAFEQISQAKQGWELAQAEAMNHPDPGSDRLRDIEQLVTVITAAENKLASRELSWRIDADEPGSVTVERGVEPAETVAVGPKGFVGKAEARVRVAAAGIRLTVESGGDDVDALFASLTEKRATLRGLLEACGAASAAAVQAMAVLHREAAATANNRKVVYESLLLGKTFEQWMEDIAAIENLPRTRETAVIDEEIGTNRTRLEEGNATARKHADAIADWKQKHTDHDMIGEKLLEAKAAVKRDMDRLASLPGLPEHFGSVREFLDTLAAANQLQVDGQKQLTGKKEDRARLTAELADRRSEDAAEQAEAAKRVFERARARGRDYVRIREELDAIAAGGGDDPLENFSAKVAAMFSRITGQAATLAFDGQLPASVHRDGVQLPPERLSHGAGGALALAIRLAMAEAHLDNDPGFIMLDDPLVNLDKDRMAEAADILRTFSERSQVIFFTCHDHHAARLQSPAMDGQAE